MELNINNTKISPSLEYSSTVFSDYEGFDVVKIPEQFGEAQEILEQVQKFVGQMNLQEKYQRNFHHVSLEQAARDASAIFENSTLEEEDYSGAETVTRVCANIALGLGINPVHSEVSVAVQPDRNDGLNPNESLHKDGVGARTVRAAEQGFATRTIRFVYAVGRPGTVLYPKITESGSPVNSLVGIIDNPSEKDNFVSPRFLDPKVVDIGKVAMQGEPSQVIPGNILVFDMANSPWHQAPDNTPGGAVLTVDVLEKIPPA